MNPDQNEIKHLRAITHPVKWRVLQALWSGRTLTATELVAAAISSSGAFAGKLRFAGYGITAPESNWDDLHQERRSRDRDLDADHRPQTRR